jgi:hypothetical protein
MLVVDTQVYTMKQQTLNISINIYSRKKTIGGMNELTAKISDYKKEALWLLKNK